MAHQSGQPAPAGPPSYYGMSDVAGEKFQQPYPGTSQYQHQHQQGNTNVVVTGQPYSLPQVSVVQPSTKISLPWTLIFAVVMTLVMGIQLFLPVFCCIVPAVVLAVVGYTKSDSKEDKHTVKSLNGVSLCCSMSALIFYTSVVVGTIVSAFITFSIIYASGGY